MDEDAKTGIWFAVLFLATAGSVACLALLFLAMRSVMAIGGSCASGGPYVTANPCPAGVGWLFPVAINLGLLCVFLTAVAAAKVGWPSIAWLGWPVLFLALGWNFWEYGLNPPGGGTVWSWIVCGVLFWGMGAAPVVLWLMHPEDRPASSRTSRAAAAGARVRTATTPPPFRREPVPATWTPAPSEADDLVDAVERLAQLHDRGKLSDAEFADAKRRLLGEDR